MMPSFEVTAIIKVDADDQEAALAKVWTLNNNIAYGLDFQEPEITFLEKIEEK